MNEVETILMDLVVNGTLKNVQDAFVNYNFVPDNSYFDYELLKAAIRRRYKGIILFLINYGCRVKNPKKNGCDDTPLHLAMLINNNIIQESNEMSNSEDMDWLDLEEVITRLLDGGASIYDKNANGDTPLYAAFKDAVEKNKTTLWIVFKLILFNFKPTNVDDLRHFHIACAMVDHHTVKRYLKCGFNPNMPMCLNVNKYDSLNPIQYAIKQNNFDFFEIFINYADFSIKDNNGLTYLHMIYNFRYPKSSRSWIKVAFRQGLNGNLNNFKDKYGLSHFHLCCMLDDPLVVQTFIDNGVDVNSSVSLESEINPGFTPLHFAVEGNDDEVLTVLLKAGADPNKADKWGITPLHLACKTSKNSRIKMLLLKYKANPTIPDSKGFTPLHVLIYNAKEEGIPTFNTAMSKAQWGSSNYEDNHGLSFFHIACTTKDICRVKMFLDSGVNVDSRVHSGKYSGFTALHFAVTYNQKAIVEFLLKRNANVNVKIDASGFSPLHLACEYIHYKKINEEKFLCECCPNQLDIIRLLLLYGAQVDAKDSFGMTPLLHTCAVIKNGKHLPYSTREEKDSLSKVNETRLQKVIQILILNKANAKSQSFNQTSILHIISEYENLQMPEEFIKFLVHSGANVNAVNDAGFTPLHVAVQCENENMIKILLKLNANPNIKCRKSRTPLQIAAEQVAKDLNDWDSVFTTEKLLDFGADINVNAEYTAYLLDFENSKRPTLGYGKLLRTIFIQVQKLLALKLPVSQLLHIRCIQFHEDFKHEYRTQSDDPDAANNSFIKRMDNTFDTCVDELNKMKNITVDQYTTLHDILLKDPHELVTHTKNNNLSRTIKKKDFPMFGRLLKLQLKKGQTRRQVLESATTALTNVLNISLPDSCCGSIFKNLENEDIDNLKKAAPAKSNLKRKLGDNYSNQIENGHGILKQNK